MNMKYDIERIRCACIHIVIGGFIFCYNLSVLNSSIENISSSLDWGDKENTFFILSNTFMPIGTFIGGLFTGSFSSRYGRRHTIISSDILTIIASALSTVQYTESFLIARFLLGVSSGTFLTIAPVFVSEITPIEYMPRFGPYVQISTDLGVFFSYIICLPLPTSDYSSHWMNNWWIFMMTVPGILAAYQLWYFMFVFTYDSPSWLMSQGRREEALKVFAYLHPSLSADSDLPDQEIDLLVPKENGEYNKIFAKDKFRKVLVIAVSLAAIQQLSGINPAIIYSSYIFKELGGSVFMSRIYTAISGTVFVVSGISSIYFLQYFGRKTLILFGETVICPLMLILGFCSLFNLNVIFSVIVVNIYYLFFSFTLGSALWTYLAETLNERLMSVSTSCNFFFVFVICFTFPVVSENIGMAYCFFFFSISMIVSWVFCKGYLIETKGRPAEEIKKDLKTLNKI